MGPAFASDYLPDDLPRRPDRLGNRLILKAFASKPSDIAHLFLVQLGSPVIRSARRLKSKHVQGVASVLAARHVFEIVRARIGLVAILVVDRLAKWAWTKEGERDDLVDGDVLLLDAVPHMAAQVAGLGRSRCNDAPAVCRPSSTIRNAIAPDATMRRSLVEVRPTRNWKPFFGLFGSHIHLVGSTT